MSDVTEANLRKPVVLAAAAHPDDIVPMSLLADHPDVRFNYLRSGIGPVAVEMH